MKKLIALTVFITLSVGNAAEADKNAGIVVSSLGNNIKYEIENKDDKRQLSKNSDIENKDWLKTDVESFLKVLLRDDTVFSLGEKTEVQFKKYVYLTKSNRKAHYKLAKGKLRSIFTVKASPEAIKIETPDVVLNVEGTEILTNVYDGQTDIVLLSGKLRVNVDGEMVVIRPGEIFNSKLYREQGRNSIVKLNAATLSHFHQHPKNFLPFMNAANVSLLNSISINNATAALNIDSKVIELANIATAYIKSSDLVNGKLLNKADSVVSKYHQRVGKVGGKALDKVSSVASGATSKVSGAISSVAPSVSVSAPAVSTPAVTVSAPAVVAPPAPAPVSAPVVSAPVVSAPVVSAPIVSAPIVSAPIVSAPVVTAPVITTPEVTTPVVEVPSVGL